MTLNKRGIKLEGEAQTEVVVMDRRAQVPPARNPAFPGIVVPKAATVHADRARCWASGIRLRVTRVTARPVLTPFQHVAAHIIQAQLIRGLRGDRMSR